MLIPPSSIANVIPEEKTSLSVTSMQSVTDAAIREVTFSPVEEVKKKMLRTLKVDFHLKE